MWTRLKRWVDGESELFDLRVTTAPRRRTARAPITGLSLRSWNVLIKSLSVLAAAASSGAKRVCFRFIGILPGIIKRILGIVG